MNGNTSLWMIFPSYLTIAHCISVRPISNPIAVARSSLQRVRYDLEEKVLSRKSWALVDHIDLEPTSMKLLKDVESIELRLLDKNREWQINWKEAKFIPLAVEITIDHTHWGKIKRLIPVQ